MVDMLWVEALAFIARPTFWLPNHSERCLSVSAVAILLRCLLRVSVSATNRWTRQYADHSPLKQRDSMTAPAHRNSSRSSRTCLKKSHRINIKFFFSGNKPSRYRLVTRPWLDQLAERDLLAPSCFYLALQWLVKSKLLAHCQKESVNIQPFLFANWSHFYELSFWQPSFSFWKIAKDRHCLFANTGDVTGRRSPQTPAAASRCPGTRPADVPGPGVDILRSSRRVDTPRKICRYLLFYTCMQVFDPKKRGSMFSIKFCNKKHGISMFFFPFCIRLGPFQNFCK